MAAPHQVRAQKKTYNVDTHFKNILGKGKFGIVYGGNGFAAKVIQDTNIAVRILNEVTPLLKLQDDNLVKLYDVASEDDCAWIIMEKCIDGNLKDYLNNGSLSLDQMVDLMIEVMSGLEYLHTHNIVHGDISPRNALVSNGKVKLADFDMCRLLDPNGETRRTSSDIAFRAPEYFIPRPDGKSPYHKNVDVFASALTFLAMLQYEGKGRSMRPHPETLVKGDRLVISIGQVLSERYLEVVSKSTGSRTTVRVRVRELGTWDCLLALFSGVVVGVATGGIAYLASGVACVSIAVALMNGLATTNCTTLKLKAGQKYLHFIDGPGYTKFSNEPFSANDNEKSEEANAKRADLRKMIQGMIAFRPENRPSPSQVKQDLETIKKY